MTEPEEVSVFEALGLEDPGTGEEETTDTGVQEPTDVNDEVADPSADDVEEEQESEEVKPDKSEKAQQETETDLPGSKTDIETLKKMKAEAYAEVKAMRQSMREAQESIRELELKRAELRGELNASSPKEQVKEEAILKALEKDDEFFDSPSAHYNALVSKVQELTQKLSESSNQPTLNPLYIQEEIARGVHEDYDSVVYDSGFDKVLKEGLANKDDKAIDIIESMKMAKNKALVYYKYAKQYAEIIDKSRKSAIMEELGISQEELEALQAKKDATVKPKGDRKPTKSIGSAAGAVEAGAPEEGSVLAGLGLVAE